jgi:hypothetical protein
VVELLAHLGLLVVEYDEVAVGHVEAGEVVYGGLGVVDVLVDHEGRASRVLARPHPDLPYRPVLPKDVVHLLARYVERQVPHVQHAVHLRRKPRVRLTQADCRHVWMPRKFWRESERMFLYFHIFIIYTNISRQSSPLHTSLLLF